MSEYLNIDMMKWRVDSIKFKDLVNELTGTTEPLLKALLYKAHKVNIPPYENPEIFFVVTGEGLQKAQHEIATQRKKMAKPQSLTALLFGNSVAVALTEEACKEKFEDLVEKHNEEQ